MTHSDTTPLWTELCPDDFSTKPKQVQDTLFFIPQDDKCGTPDMFAEMG